MAKKKWSELSTQAKVGVVSLGSRRGRGHHHRRS